VLTQKRRSLCKGVRAFYLQSAIVGSVGNGSDGAVCYMHDTPCDDNLGFTELNLAKSQYMLTLAKYNSN
jgi:hypothetical protein